jgi:two-component system NarL family sensor kinase
MIKSLFIYSLLYVLNLFSIPCFAQEKTLKQKQISVLAKEANELFKAGEYEKSLLKIRFVLRQAIAINDDYLIACCYKIIASNVDELNQFEKALFYYKKSLVYANKTTNDTIKNKLNNNLANIYCFDKKQFKTGIDYYKKSIEYGKRVKDTSGIVFTTLNMTWAYFENNRFDEGFPYLTFVNTYHKKYGDESTVIVLNMLNAMYYNYINDNEKANFYFSRAKELGLKGNEKSDLSFACQEYSKFLVKIGKYKEAYENLAIYSKINDELYNEEILTTVNAAGINLELDETKRDLKRVETGYKQKQFLLQARASKKQKILLIIIGLCILTAILLYFFFQNSKLKQKNKFNKIQSQLQKKIINATIDGQELERKKIAAFLHDNISAKLSSAGLHLFAFSATKKIEAEEITKATLILKDVHDEIRNLSHELLPTLLAKFGLFYAIQDLCEKNSNAITQFEYSSNVDLTKRYNEDYETKIYFIITELFNNIVKHSQASKVKIALIEEKEELIITIEDNGVGFATNRFKKNEGFGLTQIRARISNMKGNITINSTLNSGTFVQIKIPTKEKN